MRAVADDLHLGREPLDTAIPRGRRAKRVKAPQPSETQVVNAIRNRLALYGCLCQVNPNEAKSRNGEGRKILGTILGFPDLTVIAPDGRVAFFEVKAPGAKPSGEKGRAHWARQAETRATLARMGHLAALVRSQDEAVDTLRAAGWIR
jgi:hypothetical protein